MFTFSENTKKWFVLLGIIYLAFIMLMHKWGHQGDMTFWMDWSKYMYNHGFTHIYDNESCNYLPAYLYFLLLHVKMQGNLTDIQDNLYTIKYYTFFFDIAAAYLAVWFIKEESKKLFCFLILLFNIAFFYNTAIWGQVDAIFTFFGFAALVLAIEKKIIFSVISLLLALNFKLQALVFIPVVGLVLLPQLFSKEGFSKFLISLFLVFIIEALILLPFIVTGRLNQVMNVVLGAVGHYPYPTVGAFNMWSLVLYNTSIEGMLGLSDAIKFAGLTYQQIGRILFFSSSLIAIFPLMQYAYKKYVNPEEAPYLLSNIFLIAALVVLSFYYFNTQMHERYVHPAIILLAVYGFLSNRYFPLLGCSIAYFLNMERITWYLALHKDTYMTSILFEPKLIASFYLIIILYLFYLLYGKKQHLPCS